MQKKLLLSLVGKIFRRNIIIAKQLLETKGYNVARRTESSILNHYYKNSIQLSLTN